MPVSREILIDRSVPRSQATDLVTILFLGVCVLVPGWATIAGGADRANEAAKLENRRAQVLPSAPNSRASLEAFPARFDAWFEDAFMGRRELMRLGARAKLELFHSAIGPRWRFGRDRWLFTTDHNALPAALGVAPLGEELLERWRVTIEERRDWLADRDIEYLLVLVPYKGAIYSDRLPAGLRKRGSDHREQMLRYLRQHSSVRTVDLAPALREAAANDLPDRHAYSPHGVHWTDYGGHAAYREILEALPEFFSDVQPLQLSDFSLVGDQVQNDSWAGRISLDGVIVQSESALLPREPSYRKIQSPEGSTSRDITRVGCVDGPRVMVVHDSFGAKVTRLLATHCSRLDSRRKPYLEAHLVVEQRPDVVIEIYSELSLSTRRPFRLSAIQPSTDLGPFIEGGVGTSLLEAAAPELVPPYHQAALRPSATSVRGWTLRAEKRAALVRFELPSDVGPGDELAVHLQLYARCAGISGLYDGPTPRGIPDIGQVSPVLFPQGESQHVVPLDPRPETACRRDGLWLAFPRGTDLTIRDVAIRRVAPPRMGAARTAGGREL